MPIQIALHTRGVLLPVRAQPGSRRDAIVGVSQPPERGKANERIVEVLCEELSLRKSQLELIAGETSRSKKFLVTGVTIAELRDRLATKVGS